MRSTGNSPDAPKPRMVLQTKKATEVLSTKLAVLKAIRIGFGCRLALEVQLET